MNLDWKENKAANPFETLLGEDTEYTVHFADCEEVLDEKVQSAINAGIEKSVGLLELNLRDDSMYLLFEWDVVYSTLTIVVTDESKEKDSGHVIKCSFPELDREMNTVSEDTDNAWESRVNAHAKQVEFWIRDYLTTCTPFLNYSLIAAFHCESRDTIKLI